MERGHFPPNNLTPDQRLAELGLPGRYVIGSAIDEISAAWVGSKGVPGHDAKSGHIAIVYSDSRLVKDAKNFLVMTVVDINNVLIWTCADRSGVYGTSILDKYLPSACVAKSSTDIPGV